MIKEEANVEIDGLVTVLNILREEHDRGNFDYDPFAVFLKIAGKAKYPQAIERVNSLSRDIRNNALSREHMTQAMVVVHYCAKTLSFAYDNEVLLAAGHVLTEYLSRQQW